MENPQDRGPLRGKAMEPMPPELRAIVGRDPRVDPGSYWIDGLGWDLEGIRSDYELDQGGAVAAAGSQGLAREQRGPGPGAISKASMSGQTREPSASASFASVLSVANAKAAAGGPGRGPFRPMMAPPPGRQPPPVQPPLAEHPPSFGGGPPRAAAGDPRSRSNSTDVDNENRPYDLDTVVVNFNNVGTSFGRKFGVNTKFHWEGVRRCVKYLTEELKLKVIGVLYENWKGLDDIVQPREVQGVPADIRALCESVQETPRATGAHQRSADDEMTIKCAYRRNCRMLDNDNYRDWLKVLRNEKMRAWLEHSQERVHMKYYWDAGLGCFETLDGNAQRGASEERAPRGGSAPPAQWHGGSQGGAASQAGQYWRGSRPPRPADAGPGARKRGRSGPGAVDAGPRTAGSTGSRSSFAPPDQGDPSGIGSAYPSCLAEGYSPAAAASAGGTVFAAPPVPYSFGGLIPGEVGYRQPVAPTIGPPPIAVTGLHPNLGGSMLEVRPAFPEPADDVINRLHEGWTPVCAAVHNVQMEQVKALLEKRADPNIPNSQGAHPLYYAVERWNPRLIRLLLRHGADPALARGPFGEDVTSCARSKLGAGRQATAAAQTHRKLLNELRVDVSDLLQAAAPRPALVPAPIANATPAPEPAPAAPPPAAPPSAVAADADVVVLDAVVSPAAAASQPTAKRARAGNTLAGPVAGPQESPADVRARRRAAAKAKAGHSAARQAAPPPLREKPSPPEPRKAREAPEVKRKRVQELESRVAAAGGGGGSPEAVHTVAPAAAADVAAGARRPGIKLDPVAMDPYGGGFAEVVDVMEVDVEGSELTADAEDEAAFEAALREKLLGSACATPAAPQAPASGPAAGATAKPAGGSASSEEMPPPAPVLRAAIDPYI